MSTPFLGQLQVFASGVVPKGWAACNGQLLPINANQALYSLLGNFYGGDGRTTFALPNLQGNLMLGVGTLAGATYVPGQTGGSSTVTLNSSQIPAHIHSMVGSSAPVVTMPPAGAFPAQTNGGSYSASSNTLLGPGSSPGPGGQPHPNMQPFLAMNICIALQGIFPSRN